MQIMGIINLTPDSFSGDGVLKISETSFDKALMQAEYFIENGADSLDLGAQSTRPGATPLSCEQELDRLIPFLNRFFETHPSPPLSKQNKAIRLSLDSFIPKVIEQVYHHFPDSYKRGFIVNDILGGRDETMCRLVANLGCEYVIMHNRAKAHHILSHSDKAGQSYEAPNYQDFLSEYIDECQAMIDHVLKFNVKPDKIIFDPGIGFGKTIEQNIEILQNIHKLKELGYPVLVGASRKSFIGHILQREIDERLSGSLAVAGLAAMMECEMIRVHDVAETYDYLTMYQALTKGVN